MQKWSKYLLIVLCVGCISFGLQAQSSKAIKKKKARISNEIKALSKDLKKNAKSKRRSTLDIILLSKKIGAREELISAIGYEVRLIKRDIKRQELLIDSLQENLAILKKQYKEMVVFAYKNRNATNKLIFLFSSKDFNQAYKRLKYLDEIAEYREYQQHKIEEAKLEIQKNIQLLEEKKSSQLKLIDSKNQEKRKLKREQSNKQDLLAVLRKDEKNIKKKIRRKQKEKRRLQKEYERIVKLELEKARKKNGKMLLTPKAKKLAKNFRLNKGKLPWPVVKGYISKRYGKQRHAVLKEIVIINNGVDILCPKGTKARAAFNGTVSAVVIVQGKYAVIVQHGNYFTMYSNLSQVSVKKGDEVTTQEILGNVKTDSDGRTEIHFELWNGSIRQNPLHWLAKR